MALTLVIYSINQKSATIEYLEQLGFLPIKLCHATGRHKSYLTGRYYEPAFPIQMRFLQSRLEAQ